jgi:hypothetical protein
MHLVFVKGMSYWRTEHATGCIRLFLLVRPELLGELGPRFVVGGWQRMC